MKVISDVRLFRSIDDKLSSSIRNVLQRRCHALELFTSFVVQLCLDATTHVNQLIVRVLCSTQFFCLFDFISSSFDTIRKDFNVSLTLLRAEIVVIGALMAVGFDLIQDIAFVLSVVSSMIVFVHHFVKFLFLIIDFVLTLFNRLENEMFDEPLRMIETFGLPSRTARTRRTKVKDQRGKVRYL